MATHYEYSDIKAASSARGDGVRAATLHLQPGDTAWSPDGDEPLHGTLIVHYFIFPDGRVVTLASRVS